MASGPTKLTSPCYAIPTPADATSSQHRLRTPTLPSPTLAHSKTPTYNRPALEFAHRHSPTCPTSPLSTTSNDTPHASSALANHADPPAPRTSPTPHSAVLHHSTARLSPPHAARTEAPAIARPPCPCRLRPRFSYAPSPARAAAASASIPQPNRAGCARSSIAIVAFAPRRSKRLVRKAPDPEPAASARAGRPEPAPRPRRSSALRSQLAARLPAPPSSSNPPSPLHLRLSFAPPSPSFLVRPPRSLPTPRVSESRSPPLRARHRIPTASGSTSRQGPRRRFPRLTRTTPRSVASRRAARAPRCRERVCADTRRCDPQADANANANSPRGAGVDPSRQLSPKLSPKPRRRSLRSRCGRSLRRHAAALSEAAAGADLDGGI
ncbi:hypothetical protein B0H15DRAFT_1019773 [Mycena belliarum]|uniref:Uncharacterized protein n=1 Tax=Mycena belliarum TaxID=1033014 RepID=A0AAD6UB44_9AGAR|nr:hypothetical protein B0H15DRAFT_1019773 [Mycena belliae]